jgi:MFS family permease
MSLQTGLIDLRPLAASAPYRRLWAGTALSGLGHQMMVVAVLFQVWELTGSPVWTGMIGLASAIPMIVFGTVGGALADAVDRRVLIRWTTLGQMLAAAALAAQATAQAHHLALILALVAVQSACSALGSPARRATSSPPDWPCSTCASRAPCWRDRHWLASSSADGG